MSEKLRRVLELSEEKRDRKQFNKLLEYEPYPWQTEFHTALKDNQQVLAMCANRIGKTYAGARELGHHLTGHYPEDWCGLRFDGPIKAWACGKTNETTRDLLQNEMLGPPEQPEMMGTGVIPREMIVKVVRRPGLPGAIAAVVIKHVSGGDSLLQFKSYEMGEDKFMGANLHVVWLDEEPPANIFTQCVTRTATTGGITYMTFTPENGRTSVVIQFMEDLKPGQAMITAGWDDITHITDEVKEQLLAVYPPHEREMRTKGIPVFGSGLVYPVHLLDDQIVIEPQLLPAEWPRIVGLDFGWDHLTAAIWIAVDPATGTAYIYDEYGCRQETPIVHAAAIKARGPSIPVSWPKDGLITEKGSGRQLSELYRKEGLNLIYSHFINDASRIHSNVGAVSVEAGITEIYQAFQLGKLKIFRTCSQILAEIRVYHRKDGQVVAAFDDYVSAMRYGFCARSHASVQGETAESTRKLDYTRITEGII